MKRMVMLGVAAAFAAGCAHTGGGAPASKSLSEVLAFAGFTEVALPSTAYGPGAIITSVKGFGFQTPLRLAYICDPQYTASAPPQVDAAASQRLSSTLGGGVELSGGGLAALGLGANAEFVRSVTLEFSNVKVEQHSFQTLDGIVDGLGPECTRSLERFRGQGIARQTQQALRADVTYKATFEAGASAEAKNAVIRALLASFGGSVEGQSDTAIVGEGLYYGLILREI